jgi:hypothetical protein
VDHRQIARILAAARVAVGAAFFVAPDLAGRRWIGEVAGDPRVKLAMRGLGARDLAFGLGALRALDRGEPVAGWLQLGAVGDLSDAASGVLAARRIGVVRALGTVVTAGGAAATGLFLANHVDEDAASV